MQPMNWKNIASFSPEICTGCLLIFAGLSALGVGAHGVLPYALTPFGIGLILSDIVSKAAIASRERAKVRIRRDDDN